MNNHPALPPSKLPKVGTTIFTEMSALALECGALNIAQGFPDLSTPSELRHAVSQALEEGHNQYAPMAGNRDLRRWIADSYHAGAGYDPDTEITVGAGASSVLYAAMTALLQPGDEVVVQDPGYDLYIPVAELNQAHVVRVPLLDSDGNMNASGFANAIGPRTRLVILNSPHNPTGRVTTKRLLDTLADSMEGTDVWLLSDEVYGPMVHDGRESPVPWRHDKLRHRTLVAGSFGKLFHCTGWKVGWIAAPAKLTTELRKVHQYDVFSTGAPIQAGLVKYLPTPQAQKHLQTVGPIYEAKRDRLLRGLEGTSFTWTPAEGGYFQVIGVGAYLKAGETDGDLARRWTREYGIATIPMESFGESWEPAVRLCFAKEDETLDRAIQLLRGIPVERQHAERQHAERQHAEKQHAERQPTPLQPTSPGAHMNSNLPRLRVLALQSALVWRDPEANRNQFASLMERTLQQHPSHLVVLPEMFTTGFDMNGEAADTLDATGASETSRWMLALARRHDVSIAGSVAVRTITGQSFNRLWFATPEGDLHHYDKRHLFTLAGEDQAYEAGTSRVEITWRGWRILLQICYDLRFPGFVRNHGPQPYDLALYVANWPETRRGAWRTLLQARAIENQCFVVGVNRSGTDANNHRYAGDSLVLDHAGDVLADAGGEGQPNALHATLVKEELLAFRRKLPFLADADRFGIR
ncbi:MAG: amidohydrolase [Bacteroidetes bacterium]|nr:amidohydrolase [Bacteroidota bacterium]MDA1243238.1 amidohydrolase [Bacteroidota bacterium]